jgi:hypothetical protein
MMKSLTARLLGTFILTSGLLAAQANASVVVNFSGSDNFGVPIAGLTSTVTFTAVNNAVPLTGGTLTIEIQNTSTAGYTVADLAFNGSTGGTMLVTNVTSNQAGFPSTATVSGSGTPQLQPADGYDKFGYDLNWGVSSAVRLAPSNTATFTITYTGTLTDAALNTPTYSTTYGDNVAVLHFFGTTPDPVTGIVPTGYGGSGTGTVITQATPEPSTIALAVSGLIPLAVAGYRRRRAANA